MQLPMKKYKQVGMKKKKKIYLHQTKMTWKQVIKMMINKRNFKVLLNYVFKEKKMMYKTFEGTYLVSNHPHSPSLPLRTCSLDRGRVRRSLSRRSSRSRTRRSLQVRIPS